MGIWRPKPHGLNIWSVIYCAGKRVKNACRCRVCENGQRCSPCFWQEG